MDDEEFRRRVQARCDSLVIGVRALETAMWCYWPQTGPYCSPRDLLNDSVSLVLVQAKSLAQFVRENEGDVD